MSIYIKNKNSNIYSVRTKILNNEKIDIIDRLYIDNEAYVDYKFEDSKEYIVIISIAEKGKQTFKNKYKFVYHECDEYILDDNIKIINCYKENKLIKKGLISSFDENIGINPLISYREEKEKLSIYNSGNILLLKGNLKKIFLLILNNKKANIKDLSEEETINCINTLIMKGCVISYE